MRAVVYYKLIIFNNIKCQQMKQLNTSENVHKYVLFECFHPLCFVL